MELKANNFFCIQIFLFVLGKKVTIYVNGKETFKGTYFPNVFTTANGTFSLGVNWWDKPYKGPIDELRIYRGSIAAEDIFELAQTK
ncbi:hypothetical protein CJ195_26590 [Bacillus sp. UMB0899]|uniref:LamG-like jellyroll fold domain-containing protein n=1 Tax=Metabacillus schmidteae TaxID=2730405 RepID=UPI000C801454|nr:LamG-like jellyroll fold domain-containing protein [Metabacillus schmidteae]PMC33812.1 hypothetical protein CJ195_26590 [Bacillus sp. UMB0899]